MLFQNRLSAILMVAALVSFSGCKKSGDDTSAASVTANFSYSGAGLAPATVSFTNSSSGATSYTWDFGDNTTSTQASPSHTYTQGGVYTVMLTATGNGRSNTTTKTVNITAPTSLRITGVKVVAMPFVDPATNSGWDLNNGPDVYFLFGIVNGSTGTVLIDGSPMVKNDVAQSQLPFTWTVNPASQITNLSATYSIQVIDKDSPDADDYIGGGSFSFSSFTAGYPTTIPLQNSTGTFKVELTVQWQ